jgi:hypothetical protein
MMIRILAVICVLVVALPGSPGVEAQTDQGPRYRVVSTNRVGTLRRELSEAGRDGYRVIAAARPALLVWLVVLERSDRPHEYYYSEAVARDVRDGRILPEYELLPQTLGSFPGLSCEAIFEHHPGKSAGREYRVEEARRPLNLQQDILLAEREGFRLSAFGSGPGYCAVLDRPAESSRMTPVLASGGDAVGTPAPGASSLTSVDYSRPYVLLAHEQPAALAAAISTAAEHGFRFHSAGSGGHLAFVMERAADLGAADYHLLATAGGSDTLARELNRVAAKGYRVVPGALSTTLMTAFGSTVINDTVMLMDRNTGSAPDYLVVATARVGTFERELTAAGEDGWELVALVRAGSLTAILQRPAPQP